MDRDEVLAIVQEARRKREIPDLHGAILEWVDLYGVDLTGVNLTWANLERANLRGANLTKANLRWAKFYGTDLKGANLKGANLAGVNLTSSDLGGANLHWADLCGADLRGTNLDGSRLDGADLSETCLDPLAPIPPVSDETLLEAGFELRDGYVYGWRTKFSQVCGNTEYESGKTYTAPVFSVSETDCHPGIYLAGKAWLDTEYPGNTLVQCRCKREDIHKVGDKFRCRELEVL